MKRHADDLTIEHIIELRKQLAEAERQRDNATDVAVKIRKALLEIYWEVDDKKAHMIAARTLEGIK